MAKRIKKSAKKSPVSNLVGVLADLPRFTGKKILTMEGNAAPSSMKALTKKASLKLANAKDFSSKTSDYHQAFRQGDGIFFDTLKIAVVNEDKQEEIDYMSTRSSGNNTRLDVEPERFIYALPRIQPAKLIKAPAINFTDNNASAWGIQATNILNAAFTGKGVNIAILDTGLDLRHPDFARLTIQRKSFIKNQAVEDRNGHGTHCCGVAVGGINKKNNLRYGVAVDANLFVGKVLSNAGSGDDSGILAGIEWAIDNKCRIISMSLGSVVQPGETFSPAYEKAAKVALQKNCLIIAAAGNESMRRFGLIKPVGHPANCPSIFSVAAVDSNLDIADFSCGGINENGGQVDIAAPGVNVFSSWKQKGHKVISGTSMATPFVAGIAALLCEANPTAKAADIWMMLTQIARRINQLSTDVGAGLAQAK